MIDQKLIFVDVTARTKEEVFEFLAEAVVKNGYAYDNEQVKQALIFRENEGTTGMMDGFAIPHAKSSAIIKAGIAVVKLQDGVEWQSMDGKAVTSVIALFIPENQASTTHLEYLSKVARLLMRSDFKEAFSQAKTVEEIQTVMTTHL